MKRGIKNINEINKNSDNSLTNEPNFFLPLYIFRNGTSGLESISSYLRDAIGLRYCKIADLLNRDDRTIWGAYKSAKEKSNITFSIEESSIQIPITIFRDRSLSVLEALAEYLKEELNIRYCKISILLNKDPRTIWTVYNRAKRKRKKNVKSN